MISNINDIEVYNNGTETKNIDIEIRSNQGTGSVVYKAQVKLRGYNENPRPESNKAREHIQVDNIPPGKHTIEVVARGGGRPRIAYEELWTPSSGFPENYRLDIYIHPVKGLSANMAVLLTR